MKLNIEKRPQEKKEEEKKPVVGEELRALQPLQVKFVENPNIHQRIFAVWQQIADVPKDKAVAAAKIRYSYTSHDAVVRALKPLLIENGILMVPRVVEPFPTQKHEGITTIAMEFDFVNVDDRDDVLTVRVIGQGADIHDKGSGKAMTNATKYALLKTFLLETGDADDPDSDPEPTATMPILQAQLEEITKLAKELGVNEGQLNARSVRLYKRPVAFLSQPQAAELINRMREAQEGKDNA